MSGEGAGCRGGCTGRLLDAPISACSHVAMVRLLGRSRRRYHADFRHSYPNCILSQFPHRDRAALARSVRPAGDRNVAGPRHTLSPDHGNRALNSSRKVFCFLVSDSARSVRIPSGVRPMAGVAPASRPRIHRRDGDARTMRKALKGEESSRHDPGVKLKTYEGGITR